MPFDLMKEMTSIQKHLSDEVDIALYGKIGIISEPFRFGFYALALGVANLLIIQTISGAIGRAKDDED
jgi:hypothetical protein